jgi:cytochrome b involved in lipid metabolism
MSEKEFTMDEVREHNKQDDCWMVIGNDKTGEDIIAVYFV